MRILVISDSHGRNDDIEGVLKQVGDIDMMIHCGDPISYANLNTSYWQSHFYAYGRLSGIPDKRPYQ